jgi:MtrB/PioB family decaheme-associated outer membrane protein
MMSSTLFRAATLVGICMMPLAAAAQDDPYSMGDTAPAAAKAPEATVTGSEVEIGGRYQSQTAPMFGRYTGNGERGGIASGSFHVQGRDAGNSGGVRYYDVTGTALDLQAGNLLPGAGLGLRAGDQGVWGVNLRYDSIPYIQSGSFHSAYAPDGRGALADGMPKTGVPWTRSDLLGRSLSIQEVGTRRDVINGDAKVYLGNNFVFTTENRHDHKDGSLEQSLVFGGGKSAVPLGNSSASSGANLVYFPQPVDYDTDRYRVSLAYNGQLFQGQASYTFMNFKDNLSSFNPYDPFRPASSSLGTVNAPTLFQGVYSLPPSNSAHQARLQLAVNPAPATRVSVNLAYGLQMQNADIVPSTLNPVALQGSRFQYPGSLDGLIRTVFANVLMTTRPLPKMDIKASYTYDDRANLTDRYGIRSDTNDGTNSLGARGGLGINAPYSVEKQVIALETGYRIRPGTRVSAGYTFRRTDRTYSDVSRNTENIVSAKVTSALGGGVSAMAGYEHAVRAGEVNLAAAWNALNVSSSEDAQYKYFDAGRVTDSLRANVQYSPTHELALGLNGRYLAERYPNTVYGVTRDGRASIGPDINWEPVAGLATHAYYTYERVNFDLNGRVSGASGSPGTSPVWTDTTNNDVHSLGLGGEWKAIPDVLSVGAEYTFSYGNTSYVLADQLSPAFVGTSADRANYVIAPLPNVTSRLHGIALHAEYRVTDNASVRLGYAFERFRYKDFATGDAAITFGNTLLPGDDSLNYNVHVVGASVRYRW